MLVSVLMVFLLLGRNLSEPFHQISRLMWNTKGGLNISKGDWLFWIYLVWGDRILPETKYFLTHHSRDFSMNSEVSHDYAIRIHTRLHHSNTVFKTKNSEMTVCWANASVNTFGPINSKGPCCWLSTSGQVCNWRSRWKSMPHISFLCKTTSSQSYRIASKLLAQLSAILFALTSAL